VFALSPELPSSLLMCFPIWSVGGRKFFASPLPGYVDWMEFAHATVSDHWAFPDNQRKIRGAMCAWKSYRPAS